MCHETQIRNVPGSKNVVLLVHGIVGTPHQFDPFLSSIPANWSYVNLLLDGHGGSVEDFGRTSMKKWEAQVSSEVDHLCSKYENVFLIAHSMGTLFAIDTAVHHPDKVKGLILLSPPLKVALKRRLIRYAFHIGLSLGNNTDDEIRAVRHAYSINADRRIWKYIRWIPRYLELFSKIRRTRRKLPLLNTSTAVFLCLDDEMVSVHTDRYFENQPACTLTYLPNSTHFTYSDKDADAIRRAVCALEALI